MVIRAIIVGPLQGLVPEPKTQLLIDWGRFRTQQSQKAMTLKVTQLRMGVYAIADRIKETRRVSTPLAPCVSSGIKEPNDNSPTPAGVELREQAFARRNHSGKGAISFGRPIPDGDTAASKIPPFRGKKQRFCLSPSCFRRGKKGVVETRWGAMTNLSKPNIFRLTQPTQGKAPHRKNPPGSENLEG